jgi:hypothetical protein
MHRDPDLISASRAAEACGLGYSEEFNRLRWALEELVDPASQETVPMPASLAVPYLTGAQIAKLPAHERERYLANRTERIAWTKTQWMRVPCWGGVRPPGGEWRYSLAACCTWRARMQHAGAAI